MSSSTIRDNSCDSWEKLPLFPHSRPFAPIRGKTLTLPHLCQSVKSVDQNSLAPVLRPLSSAFCPPPSVNSEVELSPHALRVKTFANTITKTDPVRTRHLPIRCFYLIIITWIALN